MQLYCCFCKGWKPKSDTVSGPKYQDRESEIPEKKVILFWVILAITLTALRCFQVPRNTKGSDIVTIVPTSWKIKVIIKKEKGGGGGVLEEIFFFLYFDIFLHGDFTQKGLSDPWSAKHIPVGWNQNPLWIILNMPCQDLHILPRVFSNPERIH